MKGMYKWLFSIVLLMGSVALLAVSAAAAVHVDSLAAPGGDGSDWDHAYNLITLGINKAQQTSDEVWVKTGTYGAEYGSTVIYLTEPVDLYGGFAGTEITQADRDARDWKNNPTILDPQGDQCIQLNHADSPYIDGFVLTGATATALNIFSSSPTVVNCLVIDNFTTLGAVSIVSETGTGSNAFFVNCVFLNNTGQRASAVHHHSSYRYGARTVYINCTFAKNTASGSGVYGGATIAHTVGIIGVADDLIYNTIMWDNTYTTENTIDGNNYLFSSYIEGMSGYADPPSFVDLVNNNVHLAPDSPCIDAGTTAVLDPPGLPSTDFEGDPRTIGAAPDIGADEFSVSDTDNDGVPDGEEMGPDGNDPTYDGNGDSMPDCQQGNVASLHTYDGTYYVTLESPEGLASVSAVDNPSPGDTPDNVDFPYGFFEFSIDGIDPYGYATVTLYLPDVASPATYWKYGPTPDDATEHWYEFTYDGQTGAEINGNIITLHFVDGQRGDYDLTANGVIVDPGAPGVSTAIAIPGDLDGDGDVDRDDLNIILAARNTPADGPDDSRDLDGDGMITALDARKLVLLCTRPRCACEEPPD